jgi:CDP-diacylglycerol--glycerol-3-phosphate 3-phosphatidyltransferase
MWAPHRSLPNYLTITRIVLAFFLFAILHAVGWAEEQGRVGLAGEGTTAAAVLGSVRLLLNGALAIFVLAAVSDVLDGQVARYFGLVTDFGRIADPFADKVIVSGAFLFLTTIAASGVSAWMVVIIVARESLVDGIRGFVEARSIPFPASFWGKAKMVLQSICIGTILYTLANARDAAWAFYVTRTLLFLTIAITAFSGVVYVVRARAILRAGALGRAEPERTARHALTEDVRGPTGQAR